MANNFFSGCETWMEDAPVQEDGVSIAEVIESVTQASEEIEQDHEFTHEINTVVDQATMLAAKAAELDRMSAYIKANGVDRSFLHLCNYNNQLASLGMQMPACESFDAVGDPKSATSQAAMEGFAGGVVAVYEFIKRVISRCVDWLSRLLNFYDIRRVFIRKRIDALKDVKKENLSTNTSNDPDKLVYDPASLGLEVREILAITDKEFEEVKRLVAVTETTDNRRKITVFDSTTADLERKYSDILGPGTLKKPSTLLSKVATSSLSMYIKAAEEAYEGFTTIFNRIQDFRKQLADTKVAKADADSESSVYKEKAEAAKELAECVRRCKLRLNYIFTLSKAACTSAELLVKVRTKKEGKTGTESFSFAGLEASKDGSVIENLAGDGSYDKTQKRNQYLKDATEIQKKVIAAIQKAAGGKKQYKDLSAVLPKITVSPEDMCENDATFSKNKEWVYVLFKADTHWANYIAVIFGLLRAVQHYTAYDSPGISALPKGVKIARTLAGSNEFAISFCDNYKKK